MDDEVRIKGRVRLPAVAMSEVPLTPSESQASSKLRTAAWGLAIAAGARIIAAVLASSSLAAIVAQAVLVEYGTSKLGVTWTVGRVANNADAARRAGAGAALGLVVAVLLLVVLLATGAATATPSGREVSISVVGIGLVSAALEALRDELLLHGLVLRIAKDVRSVALRAAACGLASAGAALGEPGVTPANAIAHFLFGTMLGALWIRDRGAWLALGAHAAFLFATGTLFHGVVREVQLAVGAWAGARADLLGGIAAVCTLAPIAAAAVVLASRAISPSASKEG
jgi:hypothetical protein